MIGSAIGVALCAAFIGGWLIWRATRKKPETRPEMPKLRALQPLTKCGVCDHKLYENTYGCCLETRPADCPIADPFWRSKLLVEVAREREVV